MNEFIELVFEMRKAQKNYFAATKHSEAAKKWLNQSKKLEKQVDDYVEYNFINRNQLSIFDK